ncbi:c-type cytochrome [Eoetvoesiella caeni]|uniref:Mono/diheme cytochrome c family protein n=1 Tax=Eoetvoesiella caeni TaxID=645616 RepID=A0A366HAU1_9BURK|nr:c-type cytochrome [Eoetvoesiella caeni]MCI2809473.1 cytochrome c [Eoetvoesiella caeni]NYT55969.1 cytochrome c [Eoetvoesiella caeni]RBP38732.1 mono/diheme cytochrome c family protein [Eoetvoesiella caeni]
MKARIAVGGVILVAAVVGVVVLSGLLDPRYETSAVDQAAPSQELIAKGKYLAKAGDCTACHTSKAGAQFAGGVPIPTPFGTIYGTNITPDKQYGIGNWTSADFYKALHDGLAPDHPLYPAMPYTTYRGVTREDSDAIFAYLQSIRPVAVPNRDNEVSFPFNLRPLLRGWNLLFLKDTLPDVSAGNSAEWVRGRYVTNSLGHCTECHTPRGKFGQLKLHDSLQGGNLGGIVGPDITPDALAARGWSPQALQQFLAQGIAPQGSAYGEMFDAFHHSTQYLTESDNKAMVRYLTGDKPAEPVPFTPSAAIGQDQSTGRRHYLALCAGCHAANGQGKPNVTVALAGNSTVRNDDPNNLVLVMLHGITAKQFPGNQARQDMPGFANSLDDKQMAELANYLRTSFGGLKGNVQPADVQALRAKKAP